MKRRSLLLLGALAPLALFTSRYLGALSTNVRRPTDYAQLAVQLNELAANIQTPADARRLVDFLADLFSEETPSGWINNSLLNQLAQAEFLAVSDPQKTIPEPRLADAWNAYVRTIQAPEDEQATPAEIHNLRDAFPSHCPRFLESRSQEHLGGTLDLRDAARRPVSSRLRAVESVRLLWDLASQPDILKGARDRVSKGVLPFRGVPQTSKVTCVVGHTGTF